jgi:hypothetical protein
MLVVWVISQFSPLRISRSQYAYLKIWCLQKDQQYVRMDLGQLFRSYIKTGRIQQDKHEDFFKVA